MLMSVTMDKDDNMKLKEEFDYYFWFRGIHHFAIWLLEKYVDHLGVTGEITYYIYPNQKRKQFKTR